MLLNLISRGILNSKMLRLTEMRIIAGQFNPKITQFKYAFCQSSLQKAQRGKDPQLYSERAFNPSQMSKQLIQQLEQSQYQTILHQLSLYFNNLIPFDYDYFCQSLKRLIPHQQKLSLEALLMLFELSIEYKIDNLILQTHFQNQLYCRVYLSLKKELAEYDANVQTQLNNTYRMLQSNSNDHFNLIQDKFQELLSQNTHQDGNQEQSASSIKSPSIKKTRVVSKPVYNASQRRNRAKNISASTLNRITNIFLQSNSSNVEFNKLLLQANTVRLDTVVGSQKPLLPEINSEFLLTYTHLTINLLQLYMSDYHSALEASTNTQPPKYTHRSIKQIYKLQTFYYYEVAKLVQEKRLLSTASNQQLTKFLELIAGFPIKRRSFRKSIGQILIQETKKRQIPFDTLIKFFELSRFDNSLLQHFQNQINTKPQIKAAQSLVEAREQFKEEQVLKQGPLVPQRIEEYELKKQSIFQMPRQLFRKVTKKKLRSKGKKFPKRDEQEMEIDLTQAEEEISESNVSNQKIAQLSQQRDSEQNIVR